MRRAARQEERERTDAAVVIFAEAVDFVHCLQGEIEARTLEYMCVCVYIYIYEGRTNG